MAEIEVLWRNVWWNMSKGYEAGLVRHLRVF
jgi:hypothetical protein